MVLAFGKEITVIQFAVAAGIKAAQVFFALTGFGDDLFAAEVGVVIFYLQAV